MMQQQQGAPVQNQMVIAEQPSTVMAKDRSCNWTGVTVTGVMQIVCGSLIIILGIVSAVVNKFGFTYQLFGSPIWSGLLFFSIAGILGALAGMKRNRCAVVAYLVMSIFATVASFALGYFAAALTAIAAVCKSELANDGDIGWTGLCYGGADLLPVYAMLVIMAVFEFIVSIVGASMTCGIVCCGGPNRHTVYQDQVIVSTQPTVYVPGQVIQQQYAYNPTQQPAHAPPQGQVEHAPPAYDPVSHNMTQPLIK